MGESFLHVYRLPQEIEEQALVGSAVIVIDVLRATTTICQALASGATDVVPFREIDGARTAAAAAASPVVLGGERGGERIDGFDLGNSPSEYTPSLVGGRRVFITTTNGTRALYHARFARRVLAAAFVNIQAVAVSVREEARIVILCAGTDGVATEEDILAAGAIVERIEATSGEHRTLNEAAVCAKREWERVRRAAEAGEFRVREHLAHVLRDTQGGRNLVGIGLDRDLVDCAQIDSIELVPELNIANLRITAPKRENSTC